MDLMHVRMLERTRICIGKFKGGNRHALLLTRATAHARLSVAQSLNARPEMRDKFGLS